MCVDADVGMDKVITDKPSESKEYSSKFRTSINIKDHNTLRFVFYFYIIINFTRNGSCSKFN